MGHWHDVIGDLAEPTKDLRAAIPEAWKGFGQMHRGAFGDGALSRATKEIIATVIAVAQQCDGCIAYHAKSAVRAGADPQEMAEALGVALLMMGGPATVYGPRAWEAFNEFRAEA
ncbi:MAG: carboxymuconolactone decarboxylase family protein [Actinobacteria bacterium]|nr:carboxymuconolactone decarboxylase family protein [Actinomycetota bacterium]